MDLKPTLAQRLKEKSNKSSRIETENKDPEQSRRVNTEQPLTNSANSMSVDEIVESSSKRSKKVPYKTLIDKY